MRTLFLSFTFLMSTSAFANDGFTVLKTVGQLYTKVAGGCPIYLDIMRWYDYDSRGLISFALTDRPNVRPLTGYGLNATISALRLKPIGQGAFSQEVNQPVPIKSEYTLGEDKLTLNFHHKGKGSMGGIFTGESGYARQNHTLDFKFAEKNADGVFEKLELVYVDLKPIRNKKTVCSYLLEN